jgi:hypothetical protein
MIERETHDLRNLFQAVGRFTGQRGPMATPAVRPETDRAVELLDGKSAEILEDPLVVSAFVDGVQASLVLTYREHRPVYLNFTGAAAVSEDLTAVAIRERLHLVASQEDQEWTSSLRSTVPAMFLPSNSPDEVERLAVASLAGDRESLERSLIDELVVESHLPLVLDGSLVGRPIDNRLTGVVKTTNRRYLPDETVLYGLKAGWRSPRFRIPAGSHGVKADRYSCYLRLFDASRNAWNYGLVRLETFDSGMLDPLAALCLTQRQNPRSGDARGDRHLRTVRACETLLRARRPAVYDL